MIVSPLLLAAVIVLCGMVLLAVLLSRNPARRHSKRRLEAVKARHGSGNIIETQMRRITAQRTSALDNRFQRLIPNRDLLRKRIEMTGRSWTLSQYAITCAGLTVTTWLLLAIRGTPFPLTFFVGLLVGIGLPHYVIGSLAKRRTAAFVIRFPDAIELLVRGLRAGLPISETLGVVGNEIPEPVGSEFRGVADRMRIGRTMEMALQESAERINMPEFQFFVITLAIQRETGGNLAETLSNLADVLRKRMQMKLKVKAMSSESKASAYIIGSLPFIVFGLIWYINPEYMGTFFSDPRLIIAASGGGVWMGIGVFIMAKMISFEI
ncbi:type II secretion system F family protein [Sphingomonas sp. MMS24-J13]|uniref:type II secretion system F family protein n=1 Tax=Sphingomonas sp. MMS24-J13 TaxID=3238686 RepID=UPI00384E08E8